MSVSVKQDGLCSTCKNFETCMYHKNAKAPIVQCEEFENRACGARKPRRSRSPETVAKTPAAKNTEFAGLCVNCDNRRDCSLPRPDGGVWHCEEYR